MFEISKNVVISGLDPTLLLVEAEAEKGHDGTDVGHEAENDLEGSKHQNQTRNIHRFHLMLSCHFICSLSSRL